MIDEESKGVLREVVERLAHRQIASINVLGHCLKLVPELDVKRRVASELELQMQLFGRARDLYRDLGWDDLEALVREDADEIRYPQTRIEFGAAYFLTGFAEEAAMQSFVECEHEPFAAIARTYVETAPERPQPSRFQAFAAEPTNRPRAQEILTHWTAIALEAFELREATDKRARELGLRSSTTAELREAFLARLAPFAAECGLELPVAS